MPYHWQKPAPESGRQSSLNSNDYQICLYNVLQPVSKRQRSQHSNSVASPTVYVGIAKFFVFLFFNQNCWLKMCQSPTNIRRSLRKKKSRLDKTGFSDEVESLMTFTIAVFGDSGVGKSSIVRGLVDGGYTQEHIPTVEDFLVTQMAHRGKDYELHIIDTSGTYEFPAMRKVAIQKADAVVLVYSLDRPESFAKLERYMEEIKRYGRDNNQGIPVIIVSNKADLPNLSEPIFFNTNGYKISSCDYLESKWNCIWLATSARFNLNVAVIFHKLLDKLCPEKKPFSRSGSILKAVLRY